MRNTCFKGASQKRDFISLAPLNLEDFHRLFELSHRFKAELRRGVTRPLLKARTLAMIFEKPSLRTRVSFETGVTQLGGHAVFLGPNEIHLGKRETAADCARSLSRWVDLILIRTFDHKIVEEVTRVSTVPVMNGLSDLLHPCQVLADCFTLLEKKKGLKGLKIAFIGDGNNMANSWLEAYPKLGFHLSLACPPGYGPDSEIATKARQMDPSNLQITHDLEEAANEADVIYTDVWTSMGYEKEGRKRKKDFRSYQVNRKTLSLAKKDVVVMHCLPAHRGEEITDDVLDGPNSIILDQAENRLHVQKALMVWLLDQ
jgi:ornithine carbamoyltransferase